MMEYREIPGTGKMASRIVFGLAGKAFWYGKGDDELLDAVAAEGINFYDTARVYGKSEHNFGRWMENRGMRDKVVILSKCGHPNFLTWSSRVNEKDMKRDLSKSLEELRTSYIDIYLLHRDNVQKDVGAIVETFNAMHAEGKIGAFGGSNWTHERIDEANEYAYKHSLIPFTVSSPNFSLAEMVEDAMGGCLSIAGKEQEEARTWYRDNQMPVIAYASLAQGLLSGKILSTEKNDIRKHLGNIAAKGFGSEDNFERLRRCEVLAEKLGCSVSQIALAWVLQQEINTFAVVGASNIERIRENIGAFALELSPEDMQWLDLK